MFDDYCYLSLLYISRIERLERMNFLFLSSLAILGVCVAVLFGLERLMCIHMSSIVIYVCHFQHDSPGETERGEDLHKVQTQVYLLL